MPTDDYKELKIAWKELGQHLERQNTLTLRHLKENKLTHVRFGLRPLLLGQILQLVLGIIIAGVSAQFWVNHRSILHLLLGGLFLHAYGIMFIAFALRDLLLIFRIDYAAPTIVIQKQLAELRAWHIRTAFWFGLSGSVMWLPVFIIMLYWLGVDRLWIENSRGLYWLIATAAVCFGVSYGLVLLSRTSTSWGRALAASWIGRSVNHAKTALDEIEEFEREVA